MSFVLVARRTWGVVNLEFLKIIPCTLLLMLSKSVWRRGTVSKSCVTISSIRRWNKLVTTPRWMEFQEALQVVRQYHSVSTLRLTFMDASWVHSLLYATMLCVHEDLHTARLWFGIQILVRGKSQGLIGGAKGCFAIRAVDARKRLYSVPSPLRMISSTGPAGRKLDVRSW